MRGRAKACNVVEGRIRVTCPRCERKWYLAVPAGTRKKSVRCTCGMSSQYTLNHRTALREATCGKGLLFLANGRQCPVYLSDLSLGGVGFSVPHQYVRTITAGQEAQIKYRSLSGSSVQRKIRIRSVANTRIGGQFLDTRHTASW